MRKFLIFGSMLVTLLIAAADNSGQTPRRRSIPIPAPTATPASEPMVISRADEFPDENTQAIPPDPNAAREADALNRSNLQTLEELGNRIKNLEGAARKPDPDEKQKRLLLNLDILTRAEQRSESLRKQMFDMIEKENSIKTRIDALDFDLRPEAIERNAALTGSLRPEEVRAARRKSLESEKSNLQGLLTEVQRTKATLEINLQRADALVEKLRTRFEKEIDTALEDDPENDKD